MPATVKNLPAQAKRPDDLESCFTALGLTDRGTQLNHLPFTGNDISAGSETELQAVVIGHRSRVDLPLEIERSRFYSNLLRRTQSGDASLRNLTELREFLEHESTMVWENSWVRFPRQRLSVNAERVLKRDLLADKNAPEHGHRKDSERFLLHNGDGSETLRVPISYLVKLALADHLGNQRFNNSELPQLAESLQDHYTSDNTSPETFSFHVEALSPQNGMGRQLAKETSRRFLFTQLLIHYANLQFGLIESGQRAMIYFAPHSPKRQKRLNEIIPDAFYRQLFMSPCLSGWDRGEEKQKYMELCHQVLSRSQLNAVGKLREAGIILNNLVVLPDTSNTSLANNGVHISIGSNKLTSACADQRSSYGASQEKYIGDLASKIMEHFLPLFVTTYSAAPYRLAFDDFHPEKALGFLPHQLDFTHLRMLWRRWKKKASLSCLGHSLTPFGPQWIDRSLSRVFGLHGDLIPDFRLLDYPVCFLSTDQSPAYDGNLGNQDQLKHDLDDMGIFDKQMSLYQFFKLRDYSSMGFSGFEGRHYSLFPDLDRDISAATNLQILITALAFKYMLRGDVRHRHIPDTPFAESERRQIFFAMAAAIPTVYVKKTTRNRFLLRIIKRISTIRNSRRYPGYLRIERLHYCQALISLIREEGADLIEMFGFDDLLIDLERRLDPHSRTSAAARLTQGISGSKDNQARKLNAEEFNFKAESYYRNSLRTQHMQQAMQLLTDDLQQLESASTAIDREMHPLLDEVMPGKSATDFCHSITADLLADNLGMQPLKRLINLMLVAEQRDRKLADQARKTG